jgi:hypothetical protein
MQTDDLADDSNSLFSASNVVPLAKRQTTLKRGGNEAQDAVEKVNSLGYQIVEEVSIITALAVHPNKLAEGTEKYYYQRKLPSLVDNAEFSRREQRETIDFVMALTSLFKKCLTKSSHKFVAYLPNGGVVYFFTEEQFDNPLVYISDHNYEFTALLGNEGIVFKELRKRETERERIVVQGQHIKLFFGYFLNWLIVKKISIEIFSNFGFELACKEPHMVYELVENRLEYEHLAIKESSCIGEKTNRLYLIKIQTPLFREDLDKIEERLRYYELEHEKKNKNQRLAHDFEFKICKFTLELTQDAIERNPVRFE